METTTTIRGIPIKFPCEPYEIQKNYMEKVLECLQNEQNGVLESPTGTGKTLSLLCASLAWLEVKKAQVQMQRASNLTGENEEFFKALLDKLNANGGQNRSSRALVGLPTIIYASRTHSQLTQAMQELKRTAYNHMKAYVLGSREQMCIHPDIIQEPNNAMKVHLCRLKVKTRSCHFNNRIERKKDDPSIANLSIIDIEDMVKLGQSHKFCPYYMSKELKQNADILFMPYNYLLDPKARKALNIELENNVIILDEAHNIERICEESASFDIKSTDITLCIEEVTAVMRALSGDSQEFQDSDAPKDFNADEIIALKQIFLDFEKSVDAIELKTGTDQMTTFEGNYIFELLEKAGINHKNQNYIISLLDRVIQFLSTVSEGPFQRKGNGLQLFEDLLVIVFMSPTEEFVEKVQKCYKVHVTVEEQQRKKADNWLSKATAKQNCRILSYWCFSPGFGMNMLMAKGARCVILTSGTLAPLKPLISELELNIGVRLENPHIVGNDQVCVKILTKGPDGESLNCNYQNRDNPKYITSLGRTIQNLIRSIPNGVLIFFPSYPIMQKVQQSWQESGIWTNINQIKTIFVEPKDKNTFNTTMVEYYNKIHDPNLKGAIFMGVCRGKVSEGLDFADINGRAVFITGLPYPPLKSPKIILKKKYLDVCNAKDKEYLRGDEWYSLEASRAVNQAIGRVIRHKNDYGAIILLDTRFDNFRMKSQLSLWLQNRIKVVQNFGELMRDLKVFFANAKENLPEANLRPLRPEFETQSYKKDSNFDFGSSSLHNEVVIHKRIPSDGLSGLPKRKKIIVVPNSDNTEELKVSTTSTKEYIIMVKKALDEHSFKKLINALEHYRDNCCLTDLIKSLDDIFLMKYHFRYLIQGLESYIKTSDQTEFKKYCEKMC